MKKIVVPTDFSANSWAGIRFAIHWAAQCELELVFVHVLNVLRATRWSDAYFEKYAAQEADVCIQKFKKFVAGVYRAQKIQPGNHSHVVLQDADAGAAILDYCSAHPSIDAVCISTRGAGGLKKVFGTTTGNLITRSVVPVLAVPRTWRANPVKRVLYASDFRDYKAELTRVLKFAAPLQAPVDVLHFAWPNEIIFDEETVASAFRDSYSYGLNICFEKADAVHTLIENLQKQIRLKKPSVVVMFTNQERTIFQKLFFSSKAEALSFQTSVPLLVFSKRQRKAAS